MQVTVITGDEKWEYFNDGTNIGGTTKRDINYLQMVVDALTKAVEQANGQLSIILSDNA